MTHEHDSGRGLSLVANVAGMIGVVAAIIAAAVIWLVLTEPVTIVNAVDAGEISPLVSQLAEVIYKTVIGLLDYL
jgi:NCAIR mutase (PurE)-related protein